MLWACYIRWPLFVSGGVLKRTFLTFFPPLFVVTTGSRTRAWIPNNNIPVIFKCCWLFHLHLTWLNKLVLCQFLSEPLNNYLITFNIYSFCYPSWLGNVKVDVFSSESQQCGGFPLLLFSPRHSSWAVGVYQPPLHGAWLLQCAIKLIS